MAALLYSSSTGTFRSATFTYEMTMTMKAADEASAQALGKTAQFLETFTMSATGDGAMQVVDAKAGKANMRMDFDMNVMGQKITIQMVMVDNILWIRTGDEKIWQKTVITSTEQAASVMPGGMDPTSMLESFQNATNVQWVEDTTLKGEPVRHLRFAVDPKKLNLDSVLESMSKEEASSEDLKMIMEGMKVDADVWLRAKDLAVRQEKMVISVVVPAPKALDVPDAKLRMDIGMVMFFDKLNEPVEITSPANL
jgi:hypothetical protein